MKKKTFIAVLVVSLLLALGIIPAQEAAEDESIEVQHSDCALFGAGGRHLSESGLAAQARRRYALSQLTEEVMLASAASKGTRKNEVVPGGSRTDLFQQLDQLGTIDGNLFRAMQEAGANPSPKTDDYTFMRRVTLDLTGRVPAYNRLLQFINDNSADKRSRYIDELLGTSAWVDKWAMFLGDLVKNTANNTQVNRQNEGRNAFHAYLRDSLAAGKPYNTMVSEMIAATGDNSWEQGELNWNVGGIVTGGPRQDIYDQQGANVAETFLGLSHYNCILCHDGRRRMDSLSLWGKQETRLEAWQLAAFFGRTNVQRINLQGVNNRYYYRVTNNAVADYPLNTTTGNRPPRQPLGNIRNVAPEYPFNGGGTPNPGEPYRSALARFITSDIQFSRATVNYVWKEFFGRGIVDPVTQFDLDRLDADNPPPEPWTLQPSHPKLLDALARDFASGGYNLRSLMRQITNSEAYQLSAGYEGTWNPAWQNLFARKLVRRMWAEEVMDAIAQTSNIANRITVPLMDPLSWAMQLPDTRNLPGGEIGSFLDSFLRGNRVDVERRSDGSIPQVLNLMNDNFVHTRTRASGTGNTASLARQLLNKYGTGNNDALITEAFLTVLTRPPTEAEMTSARQKLAAATGATARQQRVEDLIWVLFNKVDFVYVL